MMEFDESNAIKFMRGAVGPELSEKYDDDELFNLIDLIFDYMEANGLLEIDFDEDGDDADDEIDLDDLMAYIGRMLKKDKGARISAEDARPFVDAYFDYEDSLE